MFDGKLYDGVTAHPHDVRVTVRSGGIELVQDSGWSDSVDGSLLKRIETGPGGLRLGRTDLPGWRLTLPAEADAAMEPLLGRPERYGRWIDRVGLVPAAIVGGVLTASVVAIGYLARGDSPPGAAVTESRTVPVVTVTVPATTAAP